MLKEIELGYVDYARMTCSFTKCTIMALSRIPCRHFLTIADDLGDLKDMGRFYKNCFPPYYLTSALVPTLKTFRYFPFSIGDVVSPEKVLMEGNLVKDASTNPRQQRIKSLGEGNKTSIGERILKDGE